MQQKLNDIQSALNSLKAGSSVLIFDSEDREGETDIIYPASGIEAASIKYIKDVSNNSLNAVITHEFAQKLGLLGLEQALQKIYPDLECCVRINVDKRPNFTFPVDYFSVKSGSTYTDLSLTLNSLVELFAKAEKISEPESLRSTFFHNFVIPGHLPLLIASESLLDVRKGHTELGIALAMSASIIPILVISELIDLETGETIDQEKSLKIAYERSIPYLYGEDILLMWRNEKSK